MIRRLRTPQKRNPAGRTVIVEKYSSATQNSSSIAPVARSRAASSLSHRALADCHLCVLPPAASARRQRHDTPPSTCGPRLILRSEDERYEHLGVLPVRLVRSTEITNTLQFLNLRRGQEKGRCAQHHSASSPGWVLEEHAPCQKQQRAVERMADVLERARRHQLACLLEAEQGLIRGSFVIRPAAGA